MTLKLDLPLTNSEREVPNFQKKNEKIKITRINNNQKNI